MVFFFSRLILLLFGIGAFSTYGVVTPLDNGYHHPQLQRRAGYVHTPLWKLLDQSYPHNMLDPDGTKEGQIAIKAADFGPNPWAITDFNPSGNSIYIIITAKGAAILRVPQAVFKSMYKDSRKTTLNENHVAQVKSQILGYNGRWTLRQQVDRWEHNGNANKNGHWFPDAIRIVSAAPSTAKKTPDGKSQLTHALAFNRVHHDISAFFQHGGPDNKKSIPNILESYKTPPGETPGGTREQECSLRRIAYKSGTTPPPWGSHSRPENGIAVTWEPDRQGASGIYRIWIGSQDVHNPFEEEVLYRHDWGNLAQGTPNWGWYPRDVTLDAVLTGSGPGGGCFYDPCDK